MKTFIMPIIILLSWHTTAFGQFTWMPFLQGENGKTAVSDSVSGSPTFALFNIQSPIAFSKLAMRITTPDLDPSHLYSTGIFSCPPNSHGLASDCAQLGVQLTPECTVGPRPLMVQSKSNIVQIDNCNEGSVVLQPGTYAILGAGNAPNAAYCMGRQGVNSAIPVFIHGNAINGDLRHVMNPRENVPFFVTTKMDRFTADACAVSFEN